MTRGTQEGPRPKVASVVRDETLPGPVLVSIRGFSSRWKAHRHCLAHGPQSGLVRTLGRKNIQLQVRKRLDGPLNIRDEYYRQYVSRAFSS